MASSSKTRDWKRQLKNSTLHVNSILKCEVSEHVAFCWELPDIFTLKEDIQYTVKASVAQFILIKKRASVTVFIYAMFSTSCMQVVISHGQNQLSKFYQPEEIYEREYVLELKNILKDSKNKLLQKGILRMNFIIHDQLVITKMLPGACRGILNMSDQYLLSKQVLIAYDRKSNDDFTLIVEGKRFLVNKALLAARAEYFHEYIEEHCKEEEKKVLKVDTTSAAFDTIVRYLYEGKLWCGEEEKLASVMELASRLHIHNLEELYRIYLSREYMIEDCIK